MIGNGKSISCTHKEKKDIIYKHKDGSLARETWEVKIVPEFNHDLFSFTKAMKDGWQMIWRWKEGGLMIELFKTGRASMKFDRIFPSGSSWLMGIKVHRVYDEAHAAMEAGKSVTATKLHLMTGHTGKHLLKPTANYMKLKLIGRLPPYEACAKAKIRQRNVQKKKIKKMPTKPGYRVFNDISSFKQVSRGGNKHCLIMVDEFSDYTHSFFLKKKSDQIKILPMWIKGIAKKYRIEIKRIRLDNSGENKSLQKECDNQKHGIIFEFTAPGTPQQNSVAERRIPTLMGRARAMLIQAGLEAKYKEEFWCEVISTATKLNNIMERPERTKPPHTLFYGEDAKYARSLRTFGRFWHSSVEEERNNWQMAIRKEIKSMIDRGVWRKVDRKNIPNNRRLIGNKWVFKIKRDGTYRARLVALGYSQIPGVDYTDNFAPVAHDMSFRIALARMMVETLDSLVMDVETAFLHGDIEEEIFMKSPIGMEEIDPGSSQEDCYQLKKGIYGLCQAARQFWKKFVDTIKQ